jgi:hypothetical protein
VPARPGWELAPRQSVEIECARRGTAQVVAGCIALLQGQDVDDDFILALGGPGGHRILDDGPAQRNQYWPRVWGARALLYAWTDEAEGAVVAALADEHWRVREMAAKVVAKRGLAWRSIRLPSCEVTRSLGCAQQPNARQSCLLRPRVDLVRT